MEFNSAFKGLRIKIDLVVNGRTGWQGRVKTHFQAIVNGRFSNAEKKGNLLKAL
jgi:hypothetical protein